MVDCRGRGRVGAGKQVCSRDVLGGKVGDDAVDEVLAHDDGADGLPVGGVLAEQQADGLQRHLDDGRRVAHRAHLHQVLLLNGFDGCCVVTGQARARVQKERNKRRFSERDMRRTYAG